MIGSVSGTRPSPGTAAYGAAKAGLDHLARSMAVEWAPDVRVNTLVVGMVRTELSHLHYGDEEGLAAVCPHRAARAAGRARWTSAGRRFLASDLPRTSAARACSSTAAASAPPSWTRRPPTGEPTTDPEATRRSGHDGARWPWTESATGGLWSSRAQDGAGPGPRAGLRAEGARVVVNDLGVGLDGRRDHDSPRPRSSRRSGRGRRGGGARRGHRHEPGRRIPRTTAVDTFGRLDTLVNNAGFLRDRMLVNLDEEDWDAVMRVHLKGHFLPLKHAAAHWRAEAKAGRVPQARVVNTSSGAGLSGCVGQGNYSAAKAGILGLTLVAAAELGRYGVQVNAIAPAARTRMTEAAFAETMAAPEGRLRRDGARERVAAGGLAGLGGLAGVTGRVFEAEGGRITVMEGWRPGPTATEAPVDPGRGAGTRHSNSLARRRPRRPGVRGAVAIGRAGRRITGRRTGFGDAVIRRTTA